MLAMLIIFAGVAVVKKYSKKEPLAARNQRLRRIIAEPLSQAAAAYQSTQKPARVFADFAHETTTGSWARPRRVVAKAEHIDGKENPRYTVTSLGAQDWPAQ